MKEQEKVWENFMISYRQDYRNLFKDGQMEIINFFLQLSIQTCKSIGINYRPIYEIYFPDFREMYLNYKKFLFQDSNVYKDETQLN